MDLSKIMSVSGKSGLFLSIGQTKNGLIVESLVDKKRFPVYVSDKVSSLADISVFTNDKDLPLKEIFKKIFEKENQQACIDHKLEDKKIKAYFEEILPDYDKERVYVSDMRKMLSWYNLLQSLKMLSFEEEKNEEVKEEK